MKILAIEKEIDGLTSEDFKPYLKEEALKVYELYKLGILREIYFREDQNSAVLILECKNIGEADDILGELPLVKNDLIKFDVIPLVPYPGYDRLIK